MAPEVAMPPARLYCPATRPVVPHMLGWRTRWVVLPTRNIVVPYMSIRSPGRTAPTESPSAHASIVPTATGTPSGSPVSDAAGAVTRPASSPAQASRGRAMPGATASAHGVCHSWVAAS